MKNNPNPPKGTICYASVKEIKYILIKRRENARGDNMDDAHKIQYKLLNMFIAGLIKDIVFKGHPEKVRPILKEILNFIKISAPIYADRLVGVDQMRKNIEEFNKRFK